ncbi:MAG: HAMP domain-containing histidine kinase [Treponema sp.]|nr:HAMP domain-containing histidine kinase [Treponema sp.]
MKIKTQAGFLVAGILMTPLLIILINFVYRYFITTEDIIELPSYENISALLDESISVQDWEAVTRIAGRSSRNTHITVFRDDYLVLYSTIPEFNQGVYSSQEGVLSLISSQDKTYEYSFVRRNMHESQVYVVNRLMPREARARMMPFFIPAIVLFIFIILLVLFAVCMSIIIARTITHSVQVLDDATKRIAEGELDLKLDIKGSNEITSLTCSLNKMRQALKEEELKRSRFIMGITHDLKTPLALIKGYAEAIEDDVTEDRFKAAQIITTKSDQLEGMINDLISFVRMETGEWRKQLTKIDLTSFLKNLINTMKGDVELFQHELIHDISLPEELLIPMDDRLVYRAMENLINNAIRHTPCGSVIRLTAVLANNAIKITVSDNGPGIDKEDIPHVFEMFYRGTSSRREQGMGLGLAVVKWVVDYHGWSISAQSEKDKETSFTISIDT